MENKTTLDPAEPAPRGPVRGVSSGGSPSQEVKTGQVSNWTQARYGIYVKSVTENEKKPSAAQLCSKGNEKQLRNKANHDYITE